MRRPAAILLLSAVVPALLVVPTIGRSAAAPHPVAPKLSTVALVGVDHSAWAHEVESPAATDPGVPNDTTTKPVVFTAQVRTAPYSLVGVTWDADQPTAVSPDDLQVLVRTRSQGTWQAWTQLATDSGDRPAAEETEGQTRAARVGSSPYFSGPSNGIQVRVDSQTGVLPTGLRADLVDPGASDADSHLVASVPSAAQAAAGKPAVITRAQWGADEKLRNGSATYEPTMKVLFVHHTATSNTYSKDQAAAAMRSMYAYDTNSLGWSDIAYNVLVDKFGQVFEGRAGGLDKYVRSGATGGFNAQSWAVSAIGNYVDTEPSSAMLTSIEAIIAWKLGISHRNPLGTANLTAANGSGTTAKYKDGTKVSFNVISGHRDAGATACPGTKLYAQLPAIRSAVANRMGAGLFKTSASPLLVPKGATTPIRVQATTMTAQSWRLEVTKSGSSTVIRSYQGDVPSSGLIDVSWDLKNDGGTKVPAGIYTLNLQSWNVGAAAVPYAVNANLFGDPNTLDRPADGVFRLEGRGFGHGHGMSQFGAEGAARSGLSRAQILSFYYPGTTTVTAPSDTKIRVNLGAGVRQSPSGSDMRLRAVSGLQISGAGRTLALPAKLGGKTVTVWRTLLTNGKVSLYGWTGSSYQPVSGWTGQDGPFRFTNAPTALTTARVTLMRSTGGDVIYRGIVEARRTASGTGLRAVSAVLLDDYVKSVVSAEMPGGWTSTAYEAQAVAARSYVMFKRAAAVAAGSAWHICDTTSCQVYNGYTGETSPESKAGTTTAGQYLTYGGAPIFAEFSSANGGWSADGGKPYLIAQGDPYDGVVTGTANWGHAWTADVSASRIQSAYPSLGSLQRIVITSRDGNGVWGGRVEAVRLEGTKGNVTVSGTSLRSALGLKSEWFTGQAVAPPPPPVVVPGALPAGNGAAPTAVRTVSVDNADRSARLSWAAPSDSGGSPVTSYRVTLSPGGREIKLPPATRSAQVDGLVNGRAYSASVVARNGVGASKAVTVALTPGSAYGYPVVVAPAQLWSGSLAVGTDRTVAVLGTAGVPSGEVESVTLLVTGTSTGGEGWVKVGPAGELPAVAQLSVPPAGTASNLVMVRPGAGGAVALRSSTDLQVTAEVVGYQSFNGGVGNRLIPTTPTIVATGSVNNSLGLTAQVAGTSVVPTGANAALLQVTVSAGASGASVRLSPNGKSAASVPAASALPGHTQTTAVVAPLAANGTVRVLGTGMGASVSVAVTGYYVGDDGLAGAGRTRVLAPTRVLDTRGADLSAAVPAAGSTLTVRVLGRAGVPTTGVSAVIMNVLALTPSTSGSLSVFPAGLARPSARALSYDSSSTVRTTVVAKVGAAGSVQLFVPDGGTHVLVDVAGYITG